MEETYIIRIYRRSESGEQNINVDSETDLVGIVESITSGDHTPFRNKNELWDIVSECNGVNYRGENDNSP